MLHGGMLARGALAWARPLVVRAPCAARSVLREVAASAGPARSVSASRGVALPRWFSSQVDATGADGSSPEVMLPHRPTVSEVLAKAKKDCNLGVEVYTTTAETPLLKAVQQTQQEGDKSLLVVDEADNVTGIFCETDVVIKYAFSDTSLSELTVGDVMKTPILSASCDIRASKAIEAMAARKYQHLPVLGKDGVLALEDAPVDGDVPLRFCEGVVHIRQLVSSHVKWLRTCKKLGLDVGMGDDSTVGGGTTLRSLLKTKRQDNTHHALVNTKLEDDCTVADVISAMQEKLVRSVFVYGYDNELAGIVTTHDIVRFVLVEGRDPTQVLAKEIMTANPQTVSLDSTVLDAARALMDSSFHHMPVMQPGANLAVGMLTMVDIAAALCPVLGDKKPQLESWSILSMLRRSTGGTIADQASSAPKAEASSTA